MQQLEPRGTGAGDILDFVRRRGRSTRRELQRATGLSRVTIGQRVDILLARDLLREVGPADSTGGRRPLQLEFAKTAGVVATVSINTERALVGIVDLGLAVIASAELELDITAPPARSLTRLTQTALQLAAEHGHAAGDVVGIGISVPGPVNPATGRLDEPPIMAGWDDFDILGAVQAELDVPVVVENDANAMAQGEHVRTHPDDDALVFLKVSAGIGAGIILHGSVWPGHDGGAGDIGHMRVNHDPGGRVCRCGAVGCLAADASGGSLTTQLREAGYDVGDARDVDRLVRSGDPLAVSLVGRAGRAIGEVVAAVVCVLNPTSVVIGGDLASPTLLAAIKSALLPRCMPRATRNLEVSLSTLGEDAALIGLASLVVDHVFAPERINAELAR